VLEGGYLWLGSPARRARELNDKERAFLAYSAGHYVDLKNRHKRS
ncbi:MAG: gamma carbonic anhydrase family protein, partial [Gammaproteobacteria bacterium]